MRRLPLYSGLLAALLASAAAARGDDFDPRGRHRGPARPPAAHGPARPAAPRSAEPASPQAMIDRYTQIVLTHPGDPFPLQRLAQLYRDRDGRLDALIEAMRTKTTGDPAQTYAATVALAGLYKVDGRPDAAIAAYEQAVTQKPNDPVAILALAHLYQDRGDTGSATTAYEKALAYQTTAVDRAQTLRALQTLALDAKNWELAVRLHEQLVRQEPNSLFVKGELGRELYARGEYERAVLELRDVVKAAQGDNRTLAPALKDLGRAQVKARQYDEALVTLDRALAAAGQGAAVRTEIFQTITEVYRAQQTLPLFIKKLEDLHPGDSTRLALLGSLYEETGDAPHALAAYRRALAQDPRQIDLRVRMIRLLQAEGEIDQAIAAYEGIIRAAPNNPQFIFEMCDALIQRGDRAKALRLLSEIEARASSDEEVMGRLGEFYSRIGESERAVRVLTRLADLGGGDPAHLADLGDHYFQEGKTALAVQTWKRIVTTVIPRARALAALGEVYAEHEMPSEALAALREACELDPQNLAYKKALATAFERSKAYRDASDAWEAIAGKAKQTNDKPLAREARSHVVSLWSIEHTLGRHAPELERAFAAEPPDVEAGRTLAEVYLHDRRLADAERALRRVIELAPGDAETYLALERILVQETKIDDAIAVLSALVKVDPKRARETYQRMAQYALQVYKDQDAITYASRAVELNPDDAEGHRRLGDMYRARQDADHAIVEYRAAIQKNDRLYLVYFELADLLLGKGQADEADRLYRRVLRGAPDEELVARAARQSMQINLGKGTLSSLEQDLVPLAIGNPQRAIYRKLLVEMYGNLTFGLVQRVRTGQSPKDEAEARAALARVGQRAVKPLLDALADGDGGQQRVAIDVLGYVANKNAGPALFGFATGPGDALLRLRAMVACGALRDPDLLPRYEAYLVPKGRGGVELTPTDQVAVTAAWGVARMKDPRAMPLLRALTKAVTPEIVAVATLGLGELGDRASIPLVTAMLHDREAGDVARAAAAYALGQLGATAALPDLATLAEDGDALPRQMALLALARLGSGRPSPGVLSAMADAVFSGDPSSEHGRSAFDSLRKAGAAALTIAAGASTSRAHHAGYIFPVPDGPVQVESILTALVPDGFTPAERAAVLTSFDRELGRAAATALETSAARATTVLVALGPGNGAIEPFLGAREDPTLAPARANAVRLVASLEPGILALVHHPDARLRTMALSLLAISDTDAAASALVDALHDDEHDDEDDTRVALAFLGTRPSHRTVRAARAVATILQKSDDWSLRVLAAEALGRLGQGEGDTRATSAKGLAESAIRDPYAMVREASLRALASVDSVRAFAVASQAATSDAEPRVRDAAQDIVQSHGAGAGPKGR